MKPNSVFDMLTRLNMKNDKVASEGQNKDKEENKKQRN